VVRYLINDIKSEHRPGDSNQLNEANGDETTKLPSHLQQPAHWIEGGEEAVGEDEGGEKR